MVEGVEQMALAGSGVDACKDDVRSIWKAEQEWMCSMCSMEACNVSTADSCAPAAGDPMPPDRQLQPMIHDL